MFKRLRSWWGDMIDRSIEHHEKKLREELEAHKKLPANPKRTKLIAETERKLADWSREDAALTARLDLTRREVEELREQLALDAARAELEAADRRIERADAILRKK